MSKLAMAVAMKKRMKKYAMGGEVKEEPMHEEMKEHGMEPMEDGDMISRIMAKRKYSKGGMVANDVGVAEADKLPAEYDDLVLRDDLEFSYTGANSGDELGSAAEDMRRKDIISRIMKSRKLKDKMPSPA